MLYNWYLFLESKKTEEQALKIIGDKNLVSYFKEIDKTKNQILLPIIAYFYKQKDLEYIFNIVNTLIENNLLTISLTNNGVICNNKTYNNWNDFSKEIIYINSRYEYDSYKNEKDDEKDTPIWDNNNITIYIADSRNKCIRLGKNHKTCISDEILSNNRWQNYRDKRLSTFYFIIDDNKKDTFLHNVILDATKDFIELTDSNNRNDTMNVDDYIDYLKSMGVPTEILANKPRTKTEELEYQLLGKLNTDLDWFVNLTTDYKYKYISRGYKLSEEQFNYLFNYKLWELLRKYVTSGNILTTTQFKLLETKVNILKSYIRTCYLKLDKDLFYKPTIDVIKYLVKFDLLKDKKYPNGKSDDYYKSLLKNI